MRPPAVCLDAYGTLVTLDDPVGRLAERLGAALARPVSRAAAGAAFAAEVAVYRSISLEGRDEPGRLAVVRRCAAALGAELAGWVDHRLTVDALAAILLASLVFELRPGAADCLSTLRAAGVTLAVVSNWDCSLRRVLAGLGVADACGAVIASAEVGCEKPDPRVWQPALAALGRPAGEIWHVGDEPAADIAGARAAGLRPVLLGAAPLPEGWAVPRIASLAELPELVLPAER